MTKLTYNRALPDIWRSDRGNEKSKKKSIYICIHKCLQSFLAKIKYLI